MPFDRQKERAEMLEHLVSMASNGPQWKRYAWARAKELDAGDSGLYAGISAELTSAMQSKRGQDSDSGSEDQTKTRQH